MEYAVLSKRLQEPWTAHLISRQLTSKVFDDIVANYARYGMKVLLRLLISVLNMDGKRRVECADAIKRLLDIAVNDEHNEWVRVVASLVRMRLGQGNGVDSVDETGGKILAMLKDSLSSEEVSSEASSGEDLLVEGPTFYFQPLELAYLSPELAYGINKSSVGNPHFAVTGKRSAGPQFLQREEDRAAEIRRRAVQVQPMSRQQPALSKTPSEQTKDSAAQEKAARMRTEAAKRPEAAKPLRMIKKIDLPSKMLSVDTVQQKAEKGAESTK